MKVESIEATLYKFFSEYECPKPMTTTNVSSCVGSSSHTSGAVDDPDDDEDKEDDVSELYFVWYMLCYVFLIIKIVMLCGIIFHCNFFFNDQEFDHYESGRGTKSWLYRFEGNLIFFYSHNYKILILY